MKQRAEGKGQSASGGAKGEEQILAKSAKQKVKRVKLCAMRSMLYVLCSVFIVFLGCATTQTGDIKESLEPQEATLITDIDIQDYTVTITANKPFIYTIYRPRDPFGMTIELPDVNIGTFNNRIVSDKAGITEIVPYQIESPSVMAKIEMLLQTPSIVEPEYKDNVLIIRIKEELPKEISEAIKGEEIPEEKEDVAEAAPVKQEPLPEATEISSIAFEKSAGIVKVLIKGNGSMTPNVFPLDGRIVIDIPDVVLNTTLPSAVVSPVKGIRSGKHDDKLRLVLDLKEKTNFDVASVGDTIVIALQAFEEKPSALPVAQMPEKVEVAEVKEPEVLVEGKYTGKKISLDFQNADIVPVVRLLADISGYNIVVSPEVKGKLTMKLINVPWDQVLDLILKTFSLGKSIEGNIIRIAPYTVLAKESEEAAKAKEAGIKAEALETRVFPISYADVSVVETSIKNSKILTTRGSISVDKRTSSMVIKDIISVFPEVESLLLTLDKPTPQVLIEARIVEVNTNEVLDLGIQWGGFITGNNPDLFLSGFTTFNKGTFTGERFLVDFPGGGGAGAGGGFTFGMMNPARTMGLDLQLSAVETLGKGKVISNPRIMTVDNGKAKILQGKSIPFTKLTSEGIPSEEFKDVTLELNVQPHITPDNSISTDIEIRKEELDFAFRSLQGTPSTDKKEAKTNVIIKDGETIVIGGIYKINKTDSNAGVPGLMKIPILGWLFKKHKEEAITSELLIFITPRIVQKPQI
jgi:type IV pilus assembly protein PilQ